MENLSPFHKLDFILDFYRHKTGFVYSSLKTYTELTNSGKNVKADEIDMIVRKLEVDGYLDYTEMYKEKWYKITYFGYLFHGYVKQDELNKRKEQIELDKESARKRNDRALIYGTWLAGFGGTGLLFWEILKWCYHHLPFFTYLKFWK